MKQRLVVVMAIGLLMASTAQAQETNKAEIELGVAPDFYVQTCSTPVWKGMTAVWKGVSDDRADKIVGLQTKKGEEPVAVTANPPVEKAFDAALRKLFTSCGMKLTDKGDETTTKITVEVQNFYVGVEKKLITGKATSKSLLSFLVDQGVKSTAVEVGMDLESKETRKGDIKALTKALNNLFAETLKQVVATPLLRDLK